MACFQPACLDKFVTKISISPHLLERVPTASSLITFHPSTRKVEGGTVVHPSRHTAVLENDNPCALFSAHDGWLASRAIQKTMAMVDRACEPWWRRDEEMAAECTYVFASVTITDGADVASSVPCPRFCVFFLLSSSRAAFLLRRANLFMRSKAGSSSHQTAALQRRNTAVGRRHRRGHKHGSTHGTLSAPPLQSTQHCF
ncbi:hypothetical protein R3P38DRAFT_3229645 [Favolaschia claudopus]|uniref:Uncharacterized protein n=1 Tax=Favolaschia claudopus TaxID=2862362 RepID=A0AAV9ZNN2_9AGAR